MDLFVFCTCTGACVTKQVQLSLALFGLPASVVLDNHHHEAGYHQQDNAEFAEPGDIQLRDTGLPQVCSCEEVFNHMQHHETVTGVFNMIYEMIPVGKYDYYIICTI